MFFRDFFRDFCVSKAVLRVKFTVLSIFFLFLNELFFPLGTLRTVFPLER